MELSPKSRFKGFSDIWRAQTIGDCFSERKERSGEGEMISVTINSGIRKAKDLDRTVHINDTSKYKVVRKGDIAYNSMRMWQGASGYSPYDGILSPAYTVITPRENILSEFFAYLFKHPELIHVFELNSQGLTSDTWNLKYDKLKNIVVSFPDTTDEQLIIAQFFSRLDALIAAEDKKLEKLKNLKNASLEKMFPSKGKAIPQIRFKGFVGEWRKGELSEVAGYYRVSNETVHHQNLLSLSYGKIVKRNIKSKKGLLPASFDTYQVIKENIVVLRFTDLQNDHKSLRVGLSKEEGIISPAYVCLECKSTINPDYLYLLLHYYDLCKVFYGMGDGMRQTLSYSDIKDLMLFIPEDEKEQKKIVEYFSRLDVLVSSQEKKLCKLRSLRKALLEKMFVSVQ